MVGSSFKKMGRSMTARIISARTKLPIMASLCSENLERKSLKKLSGFGFIFAIY